VSTEDQRKAETERLFEAACEYYEKDDYEKAAALFERLVEADAGVYRTQDLKLWLAACYLELSDYERARPLLDELVRTFSPAEEPLRYGHALSLAGNCRSYSGSFETAVPLLEELEQYAQALLQGGKLWLLYEGRMARGHALLWLGKPEEALRTFDLAEGGVPAGSIKPAVKSVLDYNRAVALHHMGDRDRAVRMLETVTPNSFKDESKREYWFLREHLHGLLKEHDKAIMCFKQLAALGIPDSLKAEAHSIAGRAYYYSGEGSESARHLRESMKHPTDRDWIRESSTNFLKELKKAGYE